MSNEPYTSFARSCERLQDILQAEHTVANRDSAIKRFEMTVELAWKTTQRRVAKEGVVCRSPRGCLEEAFKLGLIEDDPVWLDMLETRNLTVHTYDEQFAEHVYTRLPGYLKALQALSLRLAE